MKNRLAAAALTEPAAANLRFTQRIAPFVPEQRLFQFGEALGKIRENFRRDLAAASMRAQNSSKCDATGWRIAHDCLFENFECKPLFQFHSGGSQKRADGLGCAALASDHFSQIIGSDAQFQHSHLLAFNGSHRNIFGMIDKSFRDGLNQLLHEKPPEEGTFSWSVFAGCESGDAARVRALGKLLMAQKAAGGLARLGAASEPILDALGV